MEDNNIHEEIEEVHNQIIKDIKESSTILIHVDKEGDITLLTAGNITKKQSKTAERMLITVSPSIILLLFLSIEVFFVKLEDTASKIFKKIFNV